MITLSDLNELVLSEREVQAMRIGVVTTILAFADDPAIDFEIPSPIYRTMLENELAWRKAQMEVTE